jgi:3-oxoacyl-[acyl-carrier protein] reductase
MSKYLVFGATGSLGKETVDLLFSAGHRVVTVGRSNESACEVSLENPSWVSHAILDGELDGIVWAQGINSAGNVLTTSESELLAAFEANVVFIQRTLNQLVSGEALASTCRAVVISSMWQEHARANKFAYMVTKAALSGLVKSIAIDMAPSGLSINAVLPGVIDTPMTRANLSAEQVANIEHDTLGGALAKPGNVAQTISWLLSKESSGLTSQFITVDNGWTINRHV